MHIKHQQPKGADSDGRDNNRRKRKQNRLENEEGKTVMVVTRMRAGEEEKRIKKRRYKSINNTVSCHDDFKMSVQASRDHFCTPRQDEGPYTHVEVRYPSELEELLNMDQVPSWECGRRCT